MGRMEAVSYLIYLVYLYSFFALTFVATRQNGRTVWLFGAGSGGQRLNAMLFRIAFAGSALWPLVRAWFGPEAMKADPLHQICDSAITDIAGHFLIAIGACIAMLSQMQMGASWRVGAAEQDDSALVSDGPFAYSRNPVFVGQIILFAGMLLVFPSIVQLILSGAMLTAAVRQAAVEEQILVKNFGPDYENYIKRVNRWIGARKDRA